MNSFYFSRFEDRTPPPPLEHSALRELLWQFCATIALILGGWYIFWRWTSSLNMDALWFAIPLAVAETGAFVGLVLFVVNLWKVSDFPTSPPPQSIGECLAAPPEQDRPVRVDFFFATYNEDPELVRLGLRDAKGARYPHPAEINIHVLDDGRREEMRNVALDEGVNYITRESNIGYKAGNLRNAMEITSGDFIVICDADTRPFPTILERTLGYFRDPQVAWVQTPQWFYDIPEGRPLPAHLERTLGGFGRALGKFVERLIGPVTIGADPFVNDPKMFYDIILRRRNWANAAFCCGAGSVHRREAVMEAALRSYAGAVESTVDDTLRDWAKMSRERVISPELLAAVRNEAIISQELSPYKFHVSEDIYTSILLHADQERRWKSVLHPHVESRMLSPQDLLSWTVQRFKYAGGTLDIALNDNPIFQRGLTIPQKVMYATTFWSYLGGVWNFMFLAAPIIYLATGISPISAYSAEFFVRIIPFLVVLEIATMVGTWGLAGGQSKASYLAFFPVNLRALWTVIIGRKISFPVTPKDRQTGRHVKLIWPQLSIIVLTFCGIIFGFISIFNGWGEYTLTGVVSNSFWGLNNVFALWGIVTAALWDPEVSNLGNHI